ncbi:MAG: N-6 DNA methylase, partial [Gammaproteobacteria bacterium]|nr:N-6 DNA methylase [Gammaproteobacteria bacterium]
MPLHLIAGMSQILIVCILVKFLEDIKDAGGTHTLKEIFQNHGIRSFAEALERKLFLKVLDKLANEFNGKIFDNFSADEKCAIDQSDLSDVAAFLRADWQQYDFQYLPVELISSIYEQFLPREKGVVYTPPFLINFLIDEAMPLTTGSAKQFFSQNTFKIIDPACGSGVFLVAAYKRLLQWWSVNHFEETKEFKFPDKTVCQQILEKNIFGVDIKETAALITVFSLTIALLDKLDPKEIWHQLKLKDLSKKNIRTDNFFNWVSEASKQSFDLVIGNPPFNPLPNQTKGDAVSDQQLRKFEIKNN